MASPLTAPVPVAASARPARAASGRLSHRAGFWVTAATFFVLMAFNTVPTPLYALYQERDGFPTFLITVLFAAYAVGVMLSLYLAGHLSDRLGRRPLVLAATGLEIVAAAIFVLSPGVAGLLVARLIAGAGIGLLSATATAHLADLHRASRPATPAFAATIAGVANLGGLALGPLVGGLFAAWAPAPLVLPYAVFLVGFVALGLAYAFVPETVTPPADSFSYRPQRVRVPAGARRAYWAAGLGAFAAFSVTGLFGSVAPAFLARMLGGVDPLVAGTVSFAVFGAGAAAQVVFARLAIRRQLVLGVSAMVAGLGVLGVADLAGSVAGFVLGGVIAGAGVGLVFRGALVAAGSLGDARARSEITSGIFLLAFAGLSVPPLVIGAALLVLPLPPVLLGFVIVTISLTLWAGPAMVRTLR